MCRRNSTSEKLVERWLLQCVLVSFACVNCLITFACHGMPHWAFIVYGLCFYSHSIYVHDFAVLPQAAAILCWR
jgi:hypothetical protein